MKKKIPHDDYKPKTHSIFLSLSAAPKWAALLVGTGKEYDAFLRHLLEERFYEGMENRLSVKGMAERTGNKPAVVTKWLANMYEDIFELNDERPELFKSDGLKHTLYFHYAYGKPAFLTVWLQSTPRVYEQVTCYFVKAKVGREYFWVKEVEHSIEEDHEITINLQAGLLNKYREWLVDRARFENVIGFMEEREMESFQIDDRLLMHYRFHR